MTRAHVEKALSTSKAARDFTVALAFEIRMRLMELGHPYGFYARVGFKPIGAESIEIEVTVPFVGGANIEIDLRRTTETFGKHARPACIVLSGQLISAFMMRMTKNAPRESSPWPCCAEA